MEAVRAQTEENPDNIDAENPSDTSAIISSVRSVGRGVVSISRD